MRKCVGIKLSNHPTSICIFLLQEVTDTRVPIMLCGNKVDMREALMKQGQSCITRQQGETLARDFGAHFQETSARTGQGMVEAIVDLGR